jgi:FeS assembly protein IscX
MATFHWLDVQRISEELADRHTDVDPVTISFPRLKELVEALPGFREEPGHPCNEKILEAIQQGWIDERISLSNDD